MSYPADAELIEALETVAEDALFGVAAAGEDDEDVLLGLGKRRAQVYEDVVRNHDRVPVSNFRAWITELTAALAPVCPPAWMPMAELVKAGITVEGGARGVRSFFTSKPSEKQVEHVKRVGALAVRTL